MTNSEKSEEENNSSEEESGNSTSNDEQETPENKPQQEALSTDYEKQRQARIAANKARLQALGLPTLSNSLLGIPKTQRRSVSTPKSKRVVKNIEDDDDYMPNDGYNEGDDDEFDGSSDGEYEEEEFVGRRKGKSCSKKVKNTKSRSSMKTCTVKPMDIPDFMDEDEALKQAIALSLKDLGETSGRGGSSVGSNAKTGRVKEESRKDITPRKKKKTFTSRVQMTADDLVIHFCQFDEVGKGNITLRDVKRMAATHDFTWTDKELSDMIHCFDSDRDGKLTLDDFRNIIQRCNMLQEPEDS